jgi:hypothetical protein
MAIVIASVLAINLFTLFKFMTLVLSFVSKKNLTIKQRAKLMPLQRPDQLEKATRYCTET